MAYSDFSIKHLTKQFGLQTVRQCLFNKATLTNREPSQELLRNIKAGFRLPTLSEKAKSEFFIAPVLREWWFLTEENFTYYSGYTFNVDKEKGLAGICDYLCSTENSPEINSTVFCLVEAKDRAVEEGIAQCIAEMYAANLFNQQEGKETSAIYGCVTNGFDWLFLKLTNNVVIIDTERFYLDEQNVGLLLTVLLQIFQEFKQ
jgi:hypothetical protein